VSEQEERQLMERVYAAPKPKWDALKNRRLQSWGGLVGKNGLVSDGPLPGVSYFAIFKNFNLVARNYH
jgi:alkylated DNA repair protein alkB family protein 6